MEKTATLNLRISPEVKQQAEEVLSRLGLPMSTAIEIYLRQISLTGGIPFPVALPPAPVSVDASGWTEEQLRREIAKGLAAVQAGDTRPAKEVYADFLRKHAR